MRPLQGLPAFTPDFYRFVITSGTFVFYWILRNRSVLEIYEFIWAGLYPYSLLSLGKNHQLTTDVYDSQPAKSANTVFSYTFYYFFKYVISLICVMNSIH